MKTTAMPNKKRAREVEAPKTSKKAKLRLDELQWREVKMPDRLDDVEGFFGLEEIDDVNVVANEAGTVEFQVRLFLRIRSRVHTVDDSSWWIRSQRIRRRRN